MGRDVEHEKERNSDWTLSLDWHGSAFVLL